MLWHRSVIELTRDALKRVRMRFEKSINGKVQWTEVQCGNITHWNTIDWSVMYWSVGNGIFTNMNCVTFRTAIKSTVIAGSVTKMRCRKCKSEAQTCEALKNVTLEVRVRNVTIWDVISPTIMKWKVWQLKGKTLNNDKASNERMINDQKHNQILNNK